MSSKWITSLFKSVVLTAALVTPFAASAFTEGTDYMVLEKPIPNADKTLIKVFSYACPFCYKYDKAVTGPFLTSRRSRYVHSVPPGNKRRIWQTGQRSICSPDRQR